MVQICVMNNIKNLGGIVMKIRMEVDHCPGCDCTFLTKEWLDFRWNCGFCDSKCMKKYFKELEDAKKNMDKSVSGSGGAITLLHLRPGAG